MDKNEFLKQWRQEYVEKKGNITLANAAKNEDFKKEWKAYPNKKKPKKTPKKPPALNEYQQRRKKEDEQQEKEKAVNRARMIKWTKMLKALDKTTVKIPTKESTPTTKIIVAVIEEDLFDPRADDQFENSYYGLLVNGQVVVLGKRSFVVYQGDNMKDGAQWMLKTFPKLTYFQNNTNHINYDSASSYEKFGFDYFGPPPEEVYKFFLVKR